jgi:molecular chaperone HscB
MVQCPSCARQHEPCPICPDCGAPIAAELDCFAALGLPHKLVIDPSMLEERYHELGRRIHPDRFATGPSAVRGASLRSTALLTRSYRTLRDPVSRGRYWLDLKGEKLGENNRVPPELAELVFEVQEKLADLRSARQNGSGEARSLVADMGSQQAAIQASMDEAREQLARNFEGWDAGDGGQDGKRVAELKAILSRIAYLNRLLGDVGAELDSVKAI